MFSSVKIQPKDDNSKLVISYHVQNQSSEKASTHVCVELLDENGYVMDQGTFGEFSLKPGDWDDIEDFNIIDLNHANVWEQVRYIGLTALDKDSHCAAWNINFRKRLSPSMFFTPQAELLSEKAPRPEIKLPNDGDNRLVRLSHLSLRQTSEGVELGVKITNNAKGRVSGSLCVRLNEAFVPIDSIGFNLAAKKSVVRSELLEIDHPANWDKTRTITVYAAPYGCLDSIEEATSAVTTMQWPARKPRVARRASTKAPSSKR